MAGDPFLVHVPPRAAAESTHRAFCYCPVSAALYIAKLQAGDKATGEAEREVLKEVGEALDQLWPIGSRFSYAYMYM